MVFLIFFYKLPLKSMFFTDFFSKKIWSSKFSRPNSGDFRQIRHHWITYSKCRGEARDLMEIPLIFVEVGPRRRPDAPLAPAERPQTRQTRLLSIPHDSGRLRTR